MRVFLCFRFCLLERNELKYHIMLALWNGDFQLIVLKIERKISRTKIWCWDVLLRDCCRPSKPHRSIVKQEASSPMTTTVGHKSRLEINDFGMSGSIIDASNDADFGRARAFDLNFRCIHVPCLLDSTSSCNCWRFVCTGLYIHCSLAEIPRYLP